MEIDGVEVDVSRDDVPGAGCKEEGCPKYYESEGVGRCGECDCFVRGMSVVGKACPVAAKEGQAQHTGAYGYMDGMRDRF